MVRAIALCPLLRTIGLVLLVLAARADAAPPPERSVVLRAVPADALVVLHGRPLPDLEQPATMPTTGVAAPLPAIGLDGLIGLLTTAGVFGGTGQVYADIAACLPILARGEFALGLLDITGRTPPTTAAAATQPSFQLEELQAIVVLRTGGANEVPLAAINRIIGRYTNETEATLTTRPAGGIEVHRLIDRRAPRWAMCEWAAVEDLFIVALGDGAMDQALASLQAGRASLAGDAWFRRAVARFGGPDWLALFLNHHRAAERLPEATMGRLRAVLGALGRGGIDRDLWWAGLDGREWTLRRFYELGGRDRFYDYASVRNDTARRCIPPAARHYAVIALPLRSVINDVVAAVLASQRAARAEAMRRWWEELEAASGIDIDGEIIARLGDELIVFDYPPHPLGISAAVTMAAPIREPHRVRAAVDAACAAWQRRLNEKRNSTLLAMTVRRDDDGVWYLQAGIVGPALTVTDAYIVLSWSPQALREALAAMPAPGR